MVASRHRGAAGAATAAAPTTAERWPPFGRRSGSVPAARASRTVHPALLLRLPRSSDGLDATRQQVLVELLRVDVEAVTNPAVADSAGADDLEQGASGYPGALRLRREATQV